MNSRQLALAHLARSFVGVNSSNSEIVNRIRKASDGKATGEPWCACFVQWAVREIDGFAVDFGLQLRAQMLFNTESTQELWTRSAPELRRQAPEVGAVVVWRVDADHSRGHCGIVTEVEGVDSVGGTVHTVEGNTSATGGSTEAERNGNGVWTKRRIGGKIPTMTLLGYLLPWG